MKHKVIITSQGKVVVDETADIKEGDWYLDDTNQIRQSITSDKHYWSQRVDYYKIIYSINFSIDKDIPMIIDENEIEKLALEWCLINNFNPEDYVHSNRTAEYGRVKTIWANGYKAAQQKLIDGTWKEIS